MITNLIGTQKPDQQDNFINAIYHTFGTEYSHQAIIPTSIREIDQNDIQNFVLISSHQPLNYKQLTHNQELYDRAWQPTSNPFILTDEYAPVEHLAAY